MALWGNTDAIDVKSGGTVAINYDTGAVTGAGTSFGVTGFAQVGDILRVGTRVGTGTYFGDAVIVAVASTISSLSNHLIDSCFFLLKLNLLWRHFLRNF